MRFIARPSIRTLPLHRRHLGITALGRIRAESLERAIERVAKALKILRTMHSEEDYREKS